MALSDVESLLVGGKPEEALSQLNSLISSSPSAAAYALRSRAYEALSDYTKSLQDANEALKLDKSFGQAMLCKGNAFFKLEEWESAKLWFEKFSKLNPEDNEVKVMIRKCDAEIEFEAEDEDEEIEEKKEEKKEQKEEAKIEKEEEHKAIESLASKAAGTPASEDPLPPIARPKIRHEWYQSQTHVFVDIFVKGAKREDVEIEFKERFLSVCIKLSGSSEFSLDLDLCANIVPEACKFTVLPIKVEIKMQKASPNEKWLDLQPTNNISTLKWDDSSKVDKHQYPSSSKIKKNWDAITVEEDKLEGEQALQKVFQDIFGRGTDEQKKAMMKSFLESGGTVLSTNWEDVGSRYVEGSAPKGMEMKKWSELSHGK